jgi:hypothetical protein
MYLVNCLYSIQQPLAEHAVAQRWVPQLEDTITEHINNLARQEVGLSISQLLIPTRFSSIKSSS